MASRFPFTSFPIGWFRVAKSSDIPAGKVQTLHYFGRELVAFRTEDGKASVFDAHCPHVGAHLGHGGTVIGSTLQCPFHGWRFSGDGSCAAIPYSDKIPATALCGAASTACDRVRRSDRSARKPTASPGACGTESLPLDLSNGYVKFI